MTGLRPVPKLAGFSRSFARRRFSASRPTTRCRPCRTESGPRSRRRQVHRSVLPSSRHRWPRHLLCDSASNRDPAGFHAIPLTRRSEITPRWSLNRCRSGLHLGSKSLYYLHTLIELGGGVPPRRRNTPKPVDPAPHLSCGLCAFCISCS
jgi:hypothetical protein